MRAAVYHAFRGPIRVETVPMPEPPPGGVVLAVKATGVCRSDHHGWCGHDADIINFGKWPFIPGHECSGVVHAVGEGVSDLKVGDAVAVPFILSCGKCRECGRQRATVCQAQEQPGFTRHGAFAEYVALPRASRNLCKLPDGVSFTEAAALGCRATTAYRAIAQRGQLSEGESVAIFGCGGLGLSAVLVAIACGARVVIAVDMSPSALTMAVSLGQGGGGGTVVHAVDASQGQEATRAEVLRLTPEGLGADVTVDAGGFASTCEDALWTVRRGGRMVQVGLPLGSSAPQVPMARVANREIDIVGSHGLDAADMPAVLDLVASGKLPVRKLIERECSLSEGAAAIEAMDHGSPTGILVITDFAR